MIEPSEISVKRLPRNSENGNFKSSFIANGKLYRLINPKDGFPLSMDTVFSKFMGMLMADSDFNSLYSFLDNLENTIGEVMQNKSGITLVDAVVSIRDKKQRTKELSEAKYMWGHWLCTTFIFSEQETISDPWQQSIAESKIDDWAIEGYAREDFLELAALFIAAFNNVNNAIFSKMLEAMTRVPKGNTVG